MKKQGGYNNPISVDGTGSGANGPTRTARSPARRKGRGFNFNGNGHDQWMTPMYSGAAATQRFGSKSYGGTQTRYAGYPPDPRDWSWIDWVTIIGTATIFGVVIAGFVLLVLGRNQCCL